MNTNYNQMPQRSPLASFSALPAFVYKLDYLASNLAEPENWEYDSGYVNERDSEEFSKLRKKIGVLYQYIHHTFAKAQSEEKILISDDEKNAIMNTGLLTSSGEEIFMLFGENDNPNDDIRKFKLLGFYRQSAHEIPITFRSRLPKHIDYFESCPEDMYFNPRSIINANIEHIIRDNFIRLPESLKSLNDESEISSVFRSLMDAMQKKVLRNHRLIVPQYYNYKIMYLAPLKFGNDIITLAIEKHEDSYRANTILTMGMAYCNARLIAKPESNWLTNINT